MANEKRLVRTKDVMSFLCKRCNEMYSDEPCEPSDCLMLEELEKCPTVDAVPVVHGRWELYPSHMHRRCSVCKVEYDKPKFNIRANYCPNCGADVRGDGNV